MPPISGFIGECFRNSKTAVTFAPCVDFSIDGTAAICQISGIRVLGIVSSEGGCADGQNSRLRVLNLEFYVNRFDLRIEIERVFPEFAPNAGLFVAAER